MKKKSNKIFGIQPFILVGLIAIFCMGFVFGMIVQQQMLIKSAYEVARGLEGTTFNIEVDINETLMVDSMMDKMNEFGVFNETKADLIKEDGE